MLVIGHRGASRAAPENTPRAFALADRLGADGVELDVRLGPGGALVVHHDPLPDDADAVAAMPTLAEALDACGERMLVNVEIKNSADEPGFDPSMAVVEPVLAELDRRAATGRWVVSSFSWLTVERCRAIAPHIATAFLVVEPTDATVDQTAAAGHVAIHPWEGSLTADLVERCHRAGLAVTTWTCNDPARLVALAEMGVDAVCSDVPDVALAALGRSDPPAVRPRWGRRG